AGELLEKETLHRAELEGIFADVEKRPRLTMFDDFGGRIPSDKPPIKTPGELAIARPSQAAEAADAEAERNAHGGNGSYGGHPAGNRRGAPQGPTQPDYGAP